MRQEVYQTILCFISISLFVSEPELPNTQPAKKSELAAVITEPHSLNKPKVTKFEDTTSHPSQPSQPSQKNEIKKVSHAY